MTAREGGLPIDIHTRDVHRLRLKAITISRMMNR
ncbi:hypothetical protein J2S19_004698 [Metabacillus malikii]|uniref:Uncharacterized protein n=1 Tax=Metabacillus malikii TaxID=1504265 RepID=A0ABT9ZM43_9BACI|nr:hypothetical protein [Metabacillus malikii]